MFFGRESIQSLIFMFFFSITEQKNVTVTDDVTPDIQLCHQRRIGFCPKFATRFFRH